MKIINLQDRLAANRPGPWPSRRNLSNHKKVSSDFNGLAGGHLAAEPIRSRTDRSPCSRRAVYGVRPQLIYLLTCAILESTLQKCARILATPRGAFNLG